MKNQAILFHKDNAKVIADTLIDYTKPEELLEEYDYLLKDRLEPLVLARGLFEDGRAVLSYVVTQSMFNANNPGVELNDQTFVTVYEF